MPSDPDISDGVLQNVLWIDPFDLAESGDYGDCFWCALFWRAAKEVGAKLPGPDSYGHVRVFARPNHPIYLYWDDGREKLSIELFRPQDEKAVLSSEEYLQRFGTAVDVCPGLGSDRTFDTIRKWLKECLEDHPKCPSRERGRPRRLLELTGNLPTGGWSELRSKPNNKDISISVVQDLEEEVPYAALSHCWGSAQTLTTTLDTLPTRLEGISWDSLPQTYRDALIVTGELGLRYLWIDSLCIIQDDEYAKSPISWNQDFANMIQQRLANRASKDGRNLRRLLCDHCCCISLRR